MRKASLVALILAAFSLPLSAQQVTKVAICDLTRVLNTAYRESKTVRDYDQARADYNKEIAATNKDIADLENQKLDADKAGNRDLSLTLEKKIADRKQYLDNFKRVRGAILQQQAAALTSGPFLKEFLDVLKFVSESGGFALVLRSDGPGAGLVLYNIAEVDITEDVIKEIFSRSGKKYGGTESGGQ